MLGKIIITTKSGNNPSLFIKNSDLILNEPSYIQIYQKLQLVMNNYKKYKEAAEELALHNQNLRSKDNNTKIMKKLLESI